MNKNLLLLIVISVFTSALSIPVQAQSSNSDSIVIYVVPDTEEGWSAKKTFLGKRFTTKVSKRWELSRTCW